MKTFTNYLTILILSIISISCSENDSGSDIDNDEPDNESAVLNLWDYYHSADSIEKVVWIDNTFFISSDNERHLTDEYLGSKGVETDIRYRSGQIPSYNTLEGGRHWVFIKTTDNSGMKTLSDMRDAIDNDSVYISPTRYEPPILSTEWADGITACDRTMIITCSEGKRTEFISAVNELGAKFGPAYGDKFTIIAPPRLTPIEVSNILYEKKVVDSFEPTFSSYVVLTPPYF